MSISVQATKVGFDDDRMWVHRDDDRVPGVPLAWYPRLRHAPASERAGAWISPRGLHRDGSDEDLSIAGIIAGRSDMTRSPLKAA